MCDNPASFSGRAGFCRAPALPVMYTRATGGFYGLSAPVFWSGPKAPADDAADWVQTMPGKGYKAILPLYGPLEPWFNQTWQPGDLELQM